MVRSVFLLLCLALIGCDETAPIPIPTPDQTPLATSFDAARTGSLSGTVCWTGDVPQEPLQSIDNPLGFDNPANLMRPRDNPNALRVDPQSRSLAGAFVWLEDVDPARSRPWSAPPVRLELASQRISPNRAIVRVGEEIEIVSRDSFFHSVEGRGANHFSLSLPTANQVRRRALHTPGIVEVRSGAGFFWMRAHLLVVPHPYATTTDDKGHFSFKEVPTGVYRLVVSHPNPRVVDRERNPDNLRVMQLTFAPDRQTTRSVRVRAGHPVEVALTLGERP